MHSLKIAAVHGYEILDSRGNPTVRAEVVCEGGAMGVATAPSGASTGQFEAVELRDGSSSRYRGLGVRKAIKGIHDVIAPRLYGVSAADQGKIDCLLCSLDGTPQKESLGANAMLAVSLAAAKAAAQQMHQPLYRYSLSACHWTMRWTVFPSRQKQVCPARLSFLSTPTRSPARPE